MNDPDDMKDLVDLYIQAAEKNDFKDMKGMDGTRFWTF